MKSGQRTKKNRRADKTNSIIREAEISKKSVDRIENSATFGSKWHKAPDGTRIIRPTKPGTTITGYISKAQPFIGDSAMYPMKIFGSCKPLQLQDGDKVFLPGNKQLHRLIRKGDVIGQLVQIEYRGRQYLANGHYRKIFRLYKVKQSPTQLSKAQV